MLYISQILKSNWIPTLFLVVELDYDAAFCFLTGIDAPTDTDSLSEIVFLTRIVKFKVLSSFTLVMPLPVYLYSTRPVVFISLENGLNPNSSPYLYFEFRLKTAVVVIESNHYLQFFQL